MQLFASTYALGALVLYTLQYALLFIFRDIDVSHHELAGCVGVYVCEGLEERDIHIHTQSKREKKTVKSKWQ